MSLAVNPTAPTQNTNPKDSVQKVFQSGIFTEEFKVIFCAFMDRLIRAGTSEEQRKINLKELNETICGAKKTNEIAAKARLGNGNGHVTSVNGNGHVALEKKNLLDFLKLDKPIVFFDIKTAGSEGDEHKIVKIALVKFYPDGKKITWEKKIDPGVPIQKKATDKHGITDKDVEDSPTFEDIAPTLYGYFDDSHLGGFDILSLNTFMIRVLQKEFERSNIEFKKDGKAIVDLMSVYHRKEPGLNGHVKTLSDAVKLYCNENVEEMIKSNRDIEPTIEVLTEQFKKYPDLPQDIYKLSDFCQGKKSDSVSSNGHIDNNRVKRFIPREKFIKIDGKLAFDFGKHKGKTIEDVFNSNRGYIGWLLFLPKESGDFTVEEKSIIKSELIRLGKELELKELEISMSSSKQIA